MNENSSQEANIAGSTFEEWFNAISSGGDCDIKLAITNSRGASVRLVQEDLMNIDALVSAGRVREPPTPETFLSAEIEMIINAVSL